MVTRLFVVVPSNGQSKCVVANMIRDHMDTLLSSMMEKTDRQLHHLRKKIDRLAGSNMVSMVSFVSHSRRASLCFQFEHSLEDFRDKDEHFPKAIVRIWVWLMFILPMISSV